MNAVPEHIRTTQFPAVRMATTLGGRDLSDEELRTQLAEIFPDATAEEVESFMKTLSRIGKSIAPIAKQVLPVLVRAAPGAIQGAVTGAAAGPYGALAGAGIGAVASILASPPAAPQQGAAPPAQTMPVPQAMRAPQQTRPPASRQAPMPPAQLPPPTPLPQAAPRPPAAAPAVALPGGSRAAAIQLLALLSRPETLRALSAMLMGARGRQSVRVGQRQVPVTAFANAIAEYSADVVAAAEPQMQAEVDAAALAAGGIDTASNRARADALLGALIQQAV